MNEDKNIKTYSLIGAVCSIICSIYFFVRPFSYGATISIYYMVLCVLPYIMIAVLLLLRKKHMMWLIPSGIWLYQTFRQWHWFLFDDTLDCAVAICLILAQTILFIILLCNTIPALEKKAMAINEILWFVPAFLMFIGYVINVFNYYTIRSYYVIDTIMNLLQVIIALCIGIWINSIYPKPEVKKGIDNYSSSVAPDEFYCGMAKHVLLLLFTFGIWYLIWIYRMTNYTNAVENEEYRDPTKKLLLCMFIPLYSIYWTYKTGQRVDKMAAAKGISSDMATLCLILAIFVPIIPPILLQDKMNNIVRTNNTQPVSRQEKETVNKETFGTAEQLKEFKELLDSGVITQEEFDAKKKQLLGL